MFTKYETIYLRDTDATGVLYFSRLLEKGLEVFEDFLKSKGYTLQEMIERGDFLLPIVHAEGDFTAPLRVGEAVRITLFLKEMGSSSFTLQANFLHPEGGHGFGQTKIVHVCVDKKTGVSIPLPETLLRNLRELRQVALN